MKKILGISVLSTIVLLGQPLMALADTSGSRVINFEDIKSVIEAKNIDVQINQNSGLKDKVDLSDLKKTIKDLEDDIDSINNRKDQAISTSNFGEAISLGTEKGLLLDALKEAERGAVDKPTIEAMLDLNTSMKNDSVIRSAEGTFISYNQLNSAISTISANIETLQKKLTVMQLQESLGMVSHNTVSQVQTGLVNLQTQLASLKYQQDALERQFRVLLNDQEDTAIIGTVPTSDDFIIEDQAADLKKALENSYAVKLQELQIKLDESALDRAKKDHGASSKDYRKANYDLENANLKLAQLKDSLTSGYYTMVDNLSKLQSDLSLAKQQLADTQVSLSEAQLKMRLGMISQLEMDQATTDYKAQVNEVKTKQIDLFNAKCNYEWFLKGMPQS